MFRRRSFRPRRSSPGTTLRWVANTNLVAPLEVASGGVTSQDLTPGAPSAQWQGGTTEPTLLRIRGAWGALPRSAVSVTSGGVREVRIVAWLLAWRQQGTPALDPTVAADLSNEGVIYHTLASWDTRDFVVQASAAPVNEAYVNIAGPGIGHLEFDVKARRRVRSEYDRLILSARAVELFTQSTPPESSGQADISARLFWNMRFLYRAHR